MGHCQLLAGFAPALHLEQFFTLPVMGLHTSTVTDNQWSIPHVFSKCYCSHPVREHHAIFTCNVLHSQGRSPFGRRQRVHLLPDIEALGQSECLEALGISLDWHHVDACHFCAPFPLRLDQLNPCAGTLGTAGPGTRLVHQHPYQTDPARPPIPLLHHHVSHTLG